MTWSSHYHQYEEIKTANKMVIESLPMKDELLDTYLAQIKSVAHKIDGFIFCEFDTRDGDVIRYKIRPILERELQGRSLLIEDPHNEFVAEQLIVKSDRKPQKVALKN